MSITPCNAGLIYNLNTESCNEREIIIKDHSATLYTTNKEMLQKRFHDNGAINIWSDMTIFWFDEELQVIMQVNATNLTEEEMIRLAEGIHWLRGTL